ncbi:hypothetical protein GGS23DRAFT_616091 [Durotheca rogersii]|uniref:uncharacterized protein n=1 Tax=Durotheca rogersii TaxID=419775 RepID=UPI00221F53A4|nr:uncharacterized protein GGS23DRAFT_616091 [Durotheca rogersii]KAI5859449.1 hypothetical protein GGS23DRAFT_616091 [Durotheca rogersii]
MCRNVTLEICCAKEPTNTFPSTLKILPIVVFCAAAYASSRHELKPCSAYDPWHMRNERIFYTTCGRCIWMWVAARNGANEAGENGGDPGSKECAIIDDARAGGTNNLGSQEVTEENLRHILEYNRLLMRELLEAMHTRPYVEVLRTLPAEFGVEKRWVLSGSRWIEAQPPAPPGLGNRDLDNSADDGLGPEPPVDTELKDLKWWLDQGLGDLTDEIWNEFCSYYTYSPPLYQTQVSSGSGFPPSPANAGWPESP